MKILLASSSSGSRGGGEIYLLYLARALTRRGHEVILWASTHPRMDELCEHFSQIGKVTRSAYKNTYDYRSRSLGNFLNFKSASRIFREWNEIQPDFIHINKQNLEDGLDLLRAATHSGIPTLTTIHLTQSATYLKAIFAKLRDHISRRALNSYKAPLVCVLQERKRDLSAFLGEQPRIHSIANGVELHDLSIKQKIRALKRSELAVPQNALLISAVGRLVPQKRPLLFLELAARIHARIPHAHFIWVGDGQLAEAWDARVAQLGMGSIIRRAGWQSHVKDFLFASDVFLHTAEFEGLPLAILEALSAALPCAITPNLLAEMPFLNASNSISIADDTAWANTLMDSTRLSELGKNARRLAEEKFSHDTMAACYEALYREQIR